MPEREYRAVAEAGWKAIRDGDWDGFADLFHSDASLTIVGLNTARGRDEIHALMAYFGNGYRFDGDDINIITGKNTFATETFIDVSYVSTQPGMPEAKGQTLTMPYMMFFDMQDDKISSARMHFDMVRFMSLFNDDADPTSETDPGA